MGDPQKTRPRKRLGDKCPQCLGTDVTFYVGASRCKECHYSYQFSKYLVKTYGITIKEHAEMLVLQHGKCAICGTSDWGSNQRPCVDHDHATGKVRGLVCRMCNIGLGAFKDSVETMAKAAKYLVNSRG